jgi:hypothetical protein
MTTNGDLRARTVMWAQAGYARANGGFYEGDPSCLAKPERCIPGYPRSSETFLRPRDAAPEVNRKGYGSPPEVVDGACVVTPLLANPSDAKACRPLSLP